MALLTGNDDLDGLPCARNNIKKLTLINPEATLYLSFVLDSYHPCVHCLRKISLFSEVDSCRGKM